jgi:hypothetical protein
MPEMSHKELFERLSRLDEDASLSFKTDERFHLVIVGGGALILQEYIARATHDVDVISASPALLSLLEKYDINCQVQAYINNFPYNFEDRLILLFKGRRIDFFAASLEDIIIAKLYAMRPMDIADITSDEVLGRIDWTLLEKLATSDNEAKASAMNDRRYRDFRYSYDEFLMRYKPCGN